MINKDKQSYAAMGLLPPEGTHPLVLMTFGSHLYGTHTETSDQDFKGVFMPRVSDILLGRIPKSITVSTKKGNETKNTAADVEVEWYSLHYFIKLACEGQTTAIDMLHARADMWHTASDEWLTLHQRRHSFYTKNLRAFVGYARRQAAKYGVKGSRLASARTMLAVMEQAVNVDETMTVGQIRDFAVLAGLQHVHKTDEHLEVCGRKLQWNARIALYIDGMRRFVRNYGERAQQAEANEGIDWKAMSHALRAAFEVRAMLRDGDFRFPLPETAIIKRIKAGQLPYVDVAARLESVMDECEQLAAASELPEQANVRACERWLELRTAIYLQDSLTRYINSDELHTVGMTTRELR